MKPSKSTKRKILLSGAVILVLGIAYVVFLNYTSDEGSITTQYTSDQNQPKYQTLNGQKVTLQYNKQYAVRVLQPQSSNDVENYMLIADTVYDKRLAVSISQLPTGKLTDNSSYNLRFVHPELYTEHTEAVTAGSAMVFVNNQGGEQTAFIMHRGLVATLAFTTTGAEDQLTPEVNQLLASFRWK